MYYTRLIMLSFLMIAMVYEQKTEARMNTSSMAITMKIKDIKDEVARFMNKAMNEGYSAQSFDTFFINLVKQHEFLIARTCDDNIIPRGAEVIAKYKNPGYVENVPAFGRYCSVYVIPNAH